MLDRSNPPIADMPPPRLAEDPEWDRLVLRDQLIAARRSVAIALPVNSLLSITCALVAWHGGRGAAAVLWLVASVAVNGGRGLHHWMTRPSLRAPTAEPMSRAAIEHQLSNLCKATLASGGVWALLPLLCGLYTTPQAFFFLAVGCGITAGAVSHGAGYARAPIAFITPPILSAVATMLWVGGYDRCMLAGTMLLYLLALVVTARRAEASFCHASRLTQRMAALNASLETAHAQSLVLAEDMHRRATHDQLTGLLNRAGFLREAALQLDSRSAPACLMLLDLDGFKAINDAFGHQVGDEILVEVSSRLSTVLPEAVLIARWGGDEFAILYPTDAAVAAPALLANLLIGAVAAPYTAFGATARVGLSIGIHLSQDAELPEMLSCADLALYAAKTAGRNRHHFFGDALRSQLDLRRDVERDLPMALCDGSIAVWFQPIFGSGGTAISGLEALVRWHHPVHGWIPPADLMATAAKAGFARPLMDLILDRVCTMIATLRAQHRDHVAVAMNVSPREMAQLPVDDLILTALAVRHLPPTALEIEITEETALDIAHCARKLAVLSRAGIRIAIDDFGVGYSSLSTLRMVNVDRIKIDRCFVSGLAESKDDQVLVKAVLSLGQSLRVDVVAEGVESGADVRMLRGFGCAFMQGYHLARPMPVEECLAFLVDADAQGTLAMPATGASAA